MTCYVQRNIGEEISADFSSGIMQVRRHWSGTFKILNIPFKNESELKLLSDVPQGNKFVTTTGNVKFLPEKENALMGIFIYPKESTLEVVTIILFKLLKYYM